MCLAQRPQRSEAGEARTLYIVSCCSHLVWEFCVCSLFCGMFFVSFTSLAIIMLSEEENADSFTLCCGCLCSVSLPAVPWVGSSL